MWWCGVQERRRKGRTRLERRTAVFLSSHFPRTLTLLSFSPAGKAAIEALRSPAYAKLKGVPELPTDDAAREFLHSLIPFTFFLRVVRGPTVASGIKAIQINPQQLFTPDEYYVWLLPADQTKQLAMAVGMVAVVLAGVMFPLWPMKMRIGVWYLSMGVLGLIAAFFGLAIVRLFGWVITKVAVSPGIWLFPNLFADVGFVRLLSFSFLHLNACTDLFPLPFLPLSFPILSASIALLPSPLLMQVDSFIPLWSWDVPPPKKSKRSKEEKAAGKSSSKKDKSGVTSPKKRKGGEKAVDEGPLLEEVPEGERGQKIVELSDEDEE
jgi:translocation protein SEC62